MARNSDNLVLCPKCRDGFLVLSAAKVDQVHCAACSTSYPLKETVIDLLPEVASTRTPAQLLMEAEPVVRIYESRWWRRSLPAMLALGISFEKEQALIFRAAKLKRTDTVLDLASGPGIYTRPFAQRAPAGIVVGLDLSLQMLRYASRRVREQKLSNVVLIHGNALHLPFPADHFDLVNCCGALHLFPQPARVLHEVHRVLKPGGRFTISATRWPDGILLPVIAWSSSSLLGVQPFSVEGLKSRCERVGLRDVQCHHAERAWLIMSARKPADRS